MSSGPITSWQIDGETMETGRIYLGGLPNHCSHEIKRRLLLGRKGKKKGRKGKAGFANLDGILKSKDIPLSTKICLVKAIVFPVVMYGCESWIIKKIERRRID